MTDERERLAEELRRIRDDVRQRALLEDDTDPGLPPPRPLARVEGGTPEGGPAAAPPLPPPPDARAVNAAWPAEAPAPRGLRALLGRLLRGVLAPRHEAQVAFNARQVQLDNELLAYVQARFEATHRHYDAVLGGVGRHLGEIDERHLIVQEELVAHVQDLVRRIDLVLAESERSRRALERTLEGLKTRLQQLEERLPRG